ncbi:MAG: DNA-processing protein DprA [Ruminococcus sp.]|nr:DNA-processing protein DprA [Ruminococcus sp.]
MDEMKYWIWLTMIFGAGNIRLWEAMRNFETPAEAFERLKADENILRLKDSEKRSIKNTDLSHVSEFMRKCAENGIGIADYGSGLYPSHLRHITNPPAVLYYMGNIRCLCNTKTITAVGTRNPTRYSIYAADRICRELAAKDYVIVSGFAVGIDITTSLAAVSQRKPAACVLGCGVDVNYPKDNFRFKNDILQSGGVFVSEYPPATPPYSANFPKRNRILSAMGRISVVFEAGKGSGSLITANLAAEQGRDVFCLPPADIFSDKFSGNVMLLKDGAYPLYDTEDIDELFADGGVIDSEIHEEQYTGISVFGAGSVESIPETVPVAEYLKADSHKNIPQNKESIPGTNGYKNIPKDRKIIKEIRPKKESCKNIPQDKKIIPKNEPEQISSMPDGLTEIQVKIVKIIGKGTVHADVIARELSLGMEQLFAELTELEVLGTVNSLPGKMFELSK